MSVQLNKLLKATAAAQAATAANRVSQYTPYGNLVYQQTGVDSQGNPTWRADTSLAPAQQQMLNIQNATGVGLGNTINSALGRVQQTMGQGFNPYFDSQAYLQANPDVAAAGMDPYQHYMTYGRTEGRQAPLSKALTTSVEGANLGQVGQGPQFSQAGQAQQAYGVGAGEQSQRMGNAANLQTQVQGTGMEGWDKATGLLMSRLNPQIQQGDDRLKAQLANQGIVPGTEAYNRAMTQQGQKTNDLLTQAQLAGSNVQNQMFNQNLQAGQFGNQALTQQNQNQLANVGLNNQAIAQNFGQGLQAQQLQNQAAQQNYANQLAGLGFNNQTSQQGYANQLAAQQANNAAMQQMFANRMSNANLGNQAQQQQYNQAMTNYNLPLNTLSALRGGAQVQNPSFVNVPQQATTSGADILGATSALGNYNLGNSNAQLAAQSGMTSGLLGLGGMLGAGALMSDIRSKENIVKIGIASNGLPVYEYEYKPEWKDEAGHGKFVGYMAHEVEKVMPQAVITRPDGYKMVNYGVINA